MLHPILNLLVEDNQFSPSGHFHVCLQPLCSLHETDDDLQLIQLLKHGNLDSQETTKMSIKHGYAKLLCRNWRDESCLSTCDTKCLWTASTNCSLDGLGLASCSARSQNTIFMVYFYSTGGAWSGNDYLRDWSDANISIMQSFPVCSGQLSANFSQSFSYDHHIIMENT